MVAERGASPRAQGCHVIWYDCVELNVLVGAQPPSTIGSR
jgi:hypothetical protein